MEPKDFLGAELKIGDKVVSLDHTRTSSEFRVGEIIKITPKMVLIKTDSRYGVAKEVRVSFNKVVKLTLCKCTGGELGVRE